MTEESSPRAKGPHSSMAGLLASWASPLPFPLPSPPPNSSLMDRSLLWEPPTSSRPPRGKGPLRQLPMRPAAQRSPLLRTATSPLRRGPGHVTGNQGSGAFGPDQGVEGADAGTPKAV